MSNFSCCRKCNEYDWLSSHICDPQWQATAYDLGDEEMYGEDFYRTIYADDAKEAAEKFAERWFSDGGNYSSFFEVSVRQCESDCWQTFEISVYSVPEFVATKKKTEVEIDNG